MSFPFDLTGTLLDRRYQITGQLGKGGMGHVYEAVHVALEQRMAIKVLHPRFASEERFRERFIREARSASRIHHRNVVRISDFGETPDGSVYFVMELLDGHDIGDELRVSGAMPWPRVRHILLQAVGALRAAHAADIIHRDIKPGNCFLTSDEQEGIVDFVKLLDFGIAKVGSDSHVDAQGKGLTGTGEVFGTAAYMAPEQAKGGDLDARSDMYSLGIMAYEMLTGRVPFTGVNSIHVITKHLNEAPAPLRSHDPSIPAEVEALVLKTIAKEPAQRYDSMNALEHALRSIPGAAQPSRRTTQLWGGHGEQGNPTSDKSGALDDATKTESRAPKPKVGTPSPVKRKVPVDRTAVVSPPVVPSAVQKPVQKPVQKRTFVSPPPVVPPMGAASSAGASGAAPPPRAQAAPSHPPPGNRDRSISPPGSQGRSVPPPSHVPPGSQDRSAPPPSHAPPGSQDRSAPPPSHAPPGSQDRSVPPPSHAPPGSQDRSAPPPSHAPPGSQDRSVPPPSHAPPGSQDRSVPPPSHAPPGSQDRSVPPPSGPMSVTPASPPTHPPPGSQDRSVPPPSGPMSVPPASPPTHPPPGSQDRSVPPPSAWTSGSTSTGPLARRGDSSVETRPQSMPVSEAPAITGRMISVVVLLVLLVGGGSALGTVVFLSGQGSEPTPQAAPEPGPAVLEPETGHSENEEVEATPVGGSGEEATPLPSEEQGEEPPLAVPTGVLPTEVAPIEVPPTALPEGSDHGEPEPPPDDAVIVMEDDEPADGEQDDANEAGETGGSEPDSEPIDETPSTSKPNRPEHETAECAKVRDTATSEYKARRWGKVLGLVRKRACWSSAQQVVRTRLQVRSLAELKRFGDCVKAGRRSKDSETKGVVAACEKQVKG